MIEEGRVAREPDVLFVNEKSWNWSARDGAVSSQEGETWNGDVETCVVPGFSAWGHRAARGEREGTVCASAAAGVRHASWEGWAGGEEAAEAARERP